MKKTLCKHSGCNYYYNLNENGFCEYHQEELDNSGKEGHWKCTWCEKYKEKEFQNKDQEQRLSADI